MPGLRRLSYEHRHGAHRGHPGRKARFPRGSGRRIPPQAVPHVFIPVPGVGRWQVVQTAVDRLTIFVEPKEGFDRAARLLLREEMMKLLREDIHLEIIEAASP